MNWKPLIYQSSPLIGEITAANSSQKAGWGFHGINKKGQFTTTRKFHFFKDGKSLCGKYKQVEGYELMQFPLYKYEICQKCLTKLKKMKKVVIK